MPVSYIFLRWENNRDNRPIEHYGELDEKGYETRKIELFKDGTIEFTDGNIDVGHTYLSPEPFLPLDEFFEEDGCTGGMIPKEVFEEKWEDVVSRKEELEKKWEDIVSKKQHNHTT